MSLFKNTAGQKVRVYAFDATTGLPKAGDAGNITASVSKDFGAFADLSGSAAVEEDAVKAKGYYILTISQAETNANDIAITGRSATANVVVVGAPARMATRVAPFSPTAPMTQAYAAVGAAMSVEQALHMIWAKVAQSGIAGTVLTSNSLDGTTPAMTFTLTVDGAGNVTNCVRAT